MTLKTVTLVIGWGYLATLLVLVAFFLFLPNDSWIPTVILFAPRWPWAVPAAVLFLFAMFKKRRKLLVPAALSLVIAIWPIMGLCLPWRAALENRNSAPQWRVLSLNCDGQACDRSRLLALIEILQPDVVALQECALPIAEEDLPGGGWHRHQEQAFVLLSKLPFWHDQTAWSQFSRWAAARAVAYRFEVDGESFTFVNVHLYTPREGLEALRNKDRRAFEIIGDNTLRRREEAAAVASFIDEKKRPVLLAGDFNATVESSLYRDIFGGYQNAFSRTGWGWGYTMFTRWHGIRIDHVLADGEWIIHRSWVGPDVGSAHRPLIADVSLAPGQ